MHDRSEDVIPTVSPEDLRLAVRLFCELAFRGSPPARITPLLPPKGDFDAVEWLMGESVERIPPRAGFQEVRSFSLRLGCDHYRHMKLRVSRPGTQPVLVFGVDAHDAFLEAPPESPDYQGLQELKRCNAALASRIQAAWDSAGLETERSYLRRKIEELRQNPSSDPD
jgi:hypothetical protein